MTFVRNLSLLNLLEFFEGVKSIQITEIQLRNFPCISNSPPCFQKPQTLKVSSKAF